MAKLSNINGKFAVEDTGAIRFSDQTGTTGQILKSNGNSAPTWVDPNTVGTGPWLPLAGGVVSGATTFQSSLTVGGHVSTNGTTTLGGAVTIEGNLFMDDYNITSVNHLDFGFTSGYIEGSSTNVNFNGLSATFGGIVTVNGTYLTLGGEGYIRSDDSGYLHFQGGTTGTRFFNTSNNTALFTILNNGDATFAGNVSIDANSGILTQEILKVKGGGSGGAYGFLVEANNGDDLFKVDTSTYNCYFPSSFTNVGIGTASPGAKLQVNGSTNFGTAAQPANTSNFINNFNNDLALLIKKISTGAGDYLSIQDSAASSKFIVKSSGNVGIGTATPSSFSGYTNLSLKAGSTGNNLDFFNSAGTRIGAIVTDGNDDVILEASGLSRNLIFKTDNAGTFSERMRITSDGIVNVGGEIGNGSRFNIIGTTNTSVGYNQMNIANANSAWGLLLGFGNGLLTTGYHGLNHAAIINVQSAPLHLGTSNSAKLTILANGNVGIGEMSPESKFEISDTSVGTDPTALDSNFLMLTNKDLGTGAEVWGIGFNARSGVTNYLGAFVQAYGYFQTAGNTGLIFGTRNTSGVLAERMRIDSSGSLIVGTATVAAANAAADNFVIKGEGTAVGLTISQDSNSGTGTIFFGDAASSSVAGFRYNHNTGDMAISAEDNITFACDNVGIGTTGPDSKIQVEARNASNVIYAGFRVGYNATSNNYYDADTHHFRLGTGSSAGGNLYVGGGVYLGGTAAANNLDHYEEGNWTPVIAHNDGTGVIPITVNAARYVRVGDLVYISCYLTGINPNGNAGGSGIYYGIRGMPFTPESYGAWQIVYANAGITAYGGYSSPASLYFMSNGTNGQRSQNHLNGAQVNAWGSSLTMMMNCVYNING